MVWGEVTLGVRWMTQLIPNEMRKSPADSKRFKLSLPPMVSCCNPIQNGLAGEKRVPHRLAIAVP